MQTPGLTPNRVANLSQSARGVVRQACEQVTRTSAGNYVLGWSRYGAPAVDLKAHYDIVTLLRSCGAVAAQTSTATQMQYVITPATWKMLSEGLALAARRLRKDVHFVEHTAALAIRLGWGIRTQRGFQWRHPDDLILHMLQDLLADRLRGQDLGEHYPPVWRHVRRETLVELLQVGVEEQADRFMVYPRYQ
jgi:hypothetical protein